MKEIIFIDSDIVIEYLKTGKGVLPSAYEKYEMWMPTTSLIDIFASDTFRDSSLLSEVVEFCDKYFSFKEISKEISLKAADIIREHRITFSKACLWASAIVNEMELLVSSIKLSDDATKAGVRLVALSSS